jgi:pimeloyl-ACP methyl ester carboxylesterase
MKRQKLMRGIVGIALLLGGIALICMEPYRAHSVLATAGGCRMSVDVVEPSSGNVHGFVVLLHGISATKRIMWYVAQGFANQNLRVFVPDLPGHGRTPGPFTPARAEECTEALVQELMQRRAIVPERTILAGHSMGGAIAVRVGSGVPVAGVIAISPAPMGTPRLSPEIQLFRDSKPLPANSLVISAAWEPASVRGYAEDLVRSRSDGTSEYVVIPRATHVSLLFDSATLFHDARWAAHVLNADNSVPFPSHLALYGFLLGTVGLVVLAGPFLVEAAGPQQEVQIAEEAPAVRPTVALLQVALVSGLTVTALRAGVPLQFLHILQGDYLASFFLFGGLALLALNWKILGVSRKIAVGRILAAAVAAIVLILLFGAWLDLTFYEAWLTIPRWLRMPGAFLAFLPWHLAEEILLGGENSANRRWRTAKALAFRALAWLALMGGVFLLHSGEILMVLLSVYFGLIFVLQRLAANVVRRETRSVGAAAVFGAILLAGFCLVIFPVT